MDIAKEGIVDRVESSLNQVAEDPQRMTTSDLVKALKLTRSCICLAAADGRLSSIKVGNGKGFYLFSINDVIAAVKAGRIRPKV